MNKLFLDFEILDLNKKCICMITGENFKTKIIKDNKDQICEELWRRVTNNKEQIYDLYSTNIGFEKAFLDILDKKYNLKINIIEYGTVNRFLIDNYKI